MVGLIIALVLGIVLFALQKPGTVIFKKTTGFLYRWYMVVAVLMFAVLTVTTVVGTTSLGFLTAGPLGALFGSFAGGAVALLILFWVAVAYVLQIAGAKVLRDSLDTNSDGSTSVNTTRLVTGLAMLFLGIFGLPFHS